MRGPSFRSFHKILIQKFTKRLKLFLRNFEKQKNVKEHKMVCINHAFYLFESILCGKKFCHSRVGMFHNVISFCVSLDVILTVVKGCSSFVVKSAMASTEKDTIKPCFSHLPTSNCVKVNEET